MTNAVVALPTTGDEAAWTAAERALVEASGLVYRDGRNGPQRLAERPVVEAFLQQCMRTGLDPIARQIYCIKRGPKWQTQVSIDGARLVAERSGKYEGQEDAEWSSDGGQTWSTAWMPTDAQPYPTHARVGVFKAGHRQATRAVARWDSYVVMDAEWANGRKTGEKVSSMWAKMPDLMLAKVAEMLALRKAFPQDLSGLYSSEEMQQADRQQRAPQAASQPALVPEPVAPSEDWFAAAAAVSSKDAANALWRRIAKSERTPEVRAAIEARLAVLAEAEKPSEQAAPQWAEQQAPVEDWATAEVPQSEDVETVDGVLEGTEVEQAAPSSGYDR
ncbi:phage recombination protein Bet [Curtobacterium sp. Curtsp57]|uniref:phage recombination protein Bet n=1 Tax=Curtobacterium sp. Curtsp57 TaxID=3243047 RepID=UPI0039B64CF1